MSQTDAFLTVAGPASARIVVERSEFISHCQQARTEEEARSFIRSVQTKYPDATHNCFAYIVGAPEHEIQYLSDAGEPSGSAGRPILSAIRANSLRNCVVVVTRYFGGRKLGIPGLIRAYSDAAQLVLTKAGVAEGFVEREIHLVCSYQALGQVEYLAAKAGAAIVAQEYTDRVRLTIAVRAREADRLAEALTPLCQSLSTPESQ